MSLEEFPHLFVEGKSDKYLLVQLLKQHGMFAQDSTGEPPKDLSRINIVVEHLESKTGGTGSKSELLTDIELRIRKPKHRAIGYVFDADSPAFTDWDCARTWAAIRERMARGTAAVESPETIPLAGFVGTHSQTKTPIGIWLMPDNQSDGKLENFVRSLMDENDRLIGHADNSTRRARLEFEAKFGEKDQDKAIVQTWLSWQAEPGMSFGTAFQKRALLHDTDLAHRFVTWVRKLIEPQQSTPPL